MSFLALLALGLMVFASTNIDNLLLVIVLFADPRLSARQVVLGNYLGFLVLFFFTFACSIITVAIPPHWLGIFGMWPLLVGVRRLFYQTKEDLMGESSKAVARSVGILTVALITLANMGDNFAVYTPLFTTLTVGKIVILMIEFHFLIAASFAAARLIVTHPIASNAIRRRAQVMLPYVLMGLGIWILIRSLPKFVSAP